MSKKGIIVAGGAAAVVAPEAVDFDGTNDYLRKSSDLTGNADGKTFTVSLFIYADRALTTGGQVYNVTAGGSEFAVEYDASGKELKILGENTGGSTILSYQSPTGSLAIDTWTHVLASFNLANSGQRLVYINDADAGGSWSNFADDEIDFTASIHTIMATSSPSQMIEGRLAHLYLDYTYRDLSVEANRRHFINADLTPNEAGMDALSPILYMKMTDASTAHINSGSGGNFTLNGTVALSGRGPNQYNAPACTFDGSADFLSTTSLTGVANSKVFTLSFNFKHFSVGYQSIIALGTLGDVDYFFIRAQNSGGGEQYLNLQAFNSSYTSILNYNSNSATRNVFNKWYSVQISIDLSDTDKRHVIIDGVVQAGTWTVYTDDTIDFTHGGNTIGVSTYGAVYAEGRFDGNLSDLYFQDGEYIDLSADNPFYDTDTGKPKDLGADGSTPTGSSPLIYLPLRGDDAGDNRGTGGDFTVNSGPFTGARGPSEYWADCMDVNGSNIYLKRTTNLTGLSDGKLFSAVFFIKPDSVSGTHGIINLGTSLFGEKVRITLVNNYMELIFRSAGAPGTTLINFATSGGPYIVADTWLPIFIGIDTSGTNSSYLYFGDTQARSFTPIDEEIDFTDIYGGWYIGTRSTETAGYDGKLGFVWITNEYLDFSDEANRLLFVDAFGYPVDIGADGSTPTGTAAKIFLNRGIHLGTNSGTGGAFTPIGTPPDAGHVKG